MNSWYKIIAFLVGLSVAALLINKLQVVDEEMPQEPPANPEGTVVYCNPRDRDPKILCTSILAPVCASVNVQCIKAPCPPIEETFDNGCVACKNSLVDFYTEGECE